MSRFIGSTFNRVTYFSIKNPAAANRLASLLIKTPHDSLILPFIDYPKGPLSSEILSRDFKSLTVCDRDESNRGLFHSHIREKYPNKSVHIHPEDLFDLSFRKYSNDAQEKCSAIVRQILNSRTPLNANKENCDSHIKFLVPLLKSKYESGFLKNLYYQVSLRLGLCSDILVHYYFLMSDRQYNYLIAKPQDSFNYYRASTVLCNTVFNPHRLDTFDLKTCFHISLKKIQKTSDSTKSRYQKVHLIWLEPRTELLNSLKPENLLEFRFLVSQIMHRRSSVVLPFLQKWFCVSCEEVSQFGINEDTKSGNLDKDQYYNLYLYLKDRPEYRNSTFLQAAASAEDTFSSNV